MTNCMICKTKDARQYSSMCQSCIYNRWRWSCYPDSRYYQEQPMKKGKSIKVTKKI